MNSRKSILDMIAQEAIEGPENTIPEKKQYKKEEEELPPIDYKLELIRDENGKLYWVE